MHPQVLRILELELNLQKHLEPLQVMERIVVQVDIEQLQQFHQLERYRINGNLMKEASRSLLEY
jgi:hypothetical protein